jgi:hypothetical protein
MCIYLLENIMRQTCHFQHQQPVLFNLHSYTAANVIAGRISDTVTPVHSLPELAHLIESLSAYVPIPEGLSGFRLDMVNYAETHPVFSIELVGNHLPIHNVGIQL